MSSSSSSSPRQITVGDLSFLLSGGPTNSSPSQSLGGLPSGVLISPGSNGLFSNLSDAELEAGRTDYRCFYLANSSDDAYLYDLSLHVESESLGGASLSIGIESSLDAQVVTVSGPVFFGVVEFSFGGELFSAEWSPSAESFRQNLQSALDLLGLDAEVSYSYPGSSHKFLVEIEGNRVQPLLQVSNNLLVGLGTPAVSVERQKEGSPINSVAPRIATPEVSPFGVDFQSTSASQRISVGTLGPGDSVPVWVRRLTPPGSSRKQDSGVVIRASGSTTPS